MPRTKLNKKITNKRNRNSTADDLRVNAMADVDRGMVHIYYIYICFPNAYQRIYCNFDCNLTW